MNLRFLTGIGSIQVGSFTGVAVAVSSFPPHQGGSPWSFTVVGETGIDGPYTVGNAAVYGPPNAAVKREELGTTSMLFASEFEGGAD